MDDELEELLARAVPRRRQYVRRNAELDAKILMLLGFGIPLATVADTVGVPAATIRAWGKPDPEFRRALAEAINAGRRLNSDIAMARSAAGERRLRSLLPRSATLTFSAVSTTQHNEVSHEYPARRLASATGTRALYAASLPTTSRTAAANSNNASD